MSFLTIDVVLQWIIGYLLVRGIVDLTRSSWQYRHYLTYWLRPRQCRSDALLDSFLSLAPMLIPLFMSWMSSQTISSRSSSLPPSPTFIFDLPCSDARSGSRPQPKESFLSTFLRDPLQTTLTPSCPGTTRTPSTISKTQTAPPTVPVSQSADPITVTTSYPSSSSSESSVTKLETSPLAPGAAPLGEDIVSSVGHVTENISPELRKLAETLLTEIAAGSSYDPSVAATKPTNSVDQSSLRSLLGF